LNFIPVFLTKTETPDGITLDGIYVPPKRKSKTALIWIHGLSSRFSSGQTLIQELSSGCKKTGIGYFKLNNRGHDIINRDGSDKKFFQGAAYERFEDCLTDIKSQIALARKIGYKNIILAGHSTGANKILYYIYKTKDRRVKGLILVGPISDIAAETKRIGALKLKKALTTARRLNRKSPTLFMPQKYGVYTARRYLSLYEPGHSEDTFPYYNSEADWKELKNVRIPLAVIIGSHDEHLDRPAEELIDIFRKHAPSTKKFYGIIIKGANHGFRRKERELSKEIIKFIQRAIV